MMDENELIHELERELKHQNLWRVIMSLAYFLSTALAIVASGAATIFAGMDKAQTAAILAGSATVLFGLEKAMLFREKWGLHLATSAQLQALKVQFSFGEMDANKAAHVMSNILTHYASNLPSLKRSED